MHLWPLQTHLIVRSMVCSHRNSIITLVPCTNICELSLPEIVFSALTLFVAHQEEHLA